MNSCVQAAASLPLSHRARNTLHARSRHRILLRRDRRRPVDTDAGARRGCSRTRCTARSRCTQAYGGVVPELASRDHIRRVLPLTRAGAARRPAARSPTSTSSPTPRPGPGRRAAGRRRRAPARWRCALGKPALGVHHLEGHLLSPFLLGRPARVPLRRAAGLRRAHAADAGRRRRALRAARRDASTTPPARPSTRPPSCWASAIPAGRRWRSWRSSAIRGASSCRGRCCTAAISTFSFCRPEDRGADAVRRSASGEPAARRPGARVDRRTRSSTCWCESRWRALDATGLAPAGRRRRRRRQRGAARSA